MQGNKNLYGHVRRQGCPKRDQTPHFVHDGTHYPSFILGNTHGGTHLYMFYSVNAYMQKGKVYSGNAKTQRPINIINFINHQMHQFHPVSCHMSLASSSAPAPCLRNICNRRRRRQRDLHFGCAAARRREVQPVGFPEGVMNQV